MEDTRKHGLLNKLIKRLFMYTLFLSLRRLERVGIYYYLFVDPDGCGECDAHKTDILVTINPKSKGGDFHA